MALFVAALAILFIVRVVEVLVVLFLAVLCAVYLSAITDLLERRFRVARLLGLTAAVLATLAVVAGIGAIILSPVVEQTQALIAGLPQTLTNTQNVIAAWAREYPFLRNTELANPQSGLVAGLINDATTFLRGSLPRYVTGSGKLFIESASVVVMALYLARQPRLYSDGILSLIAPRHRPVAARIVEDAKATLRAWVVAQILAMLVLAILTAIGLWVLGVPYWLAFGIFTGLVAVVPFFGSLVSTPIINYPQVGILGLHKTQDRPVAINGQVVIRPMMYIALSYDHRIVEGAHAVQFLVRVKELIEDPAAMLIE